MPLISLKYTSSHPNDLEQGNIASIYQFWIAMLIKAGGLVGKYALTAEMTGDTQSKPLALIPFLRQLKKLIGWNGQIAYLRYGKIWREMSTSHVLSGCVGVWLLI